MGAPLQAAEPNARGRLRRKLKDVALRQRDHLLRDVRVLKLGEDDDVSDLGRQVLRDGTADVDDACEASAPLGMLGVRTRDINHGKAEVVRVPPNCELVPRQEITESRVEHRIVLEQLWAVLDMLPIRLRMDGGDEGYEFEAVRAQRLLIQRIGKVDIVGSRAIELGLREDRFWRRRCEIVNEGHGRQDGVVCRFASNLLWIIHTHRRGRLLTRSPYYRPEYDCDRS